MMLSLSKGGVALLAVATWPMLTHALVPSLFYTFDQDLSESNGMGPDLIANGGSVAGGLYVMPADNTGPTLDVTTLNPSLTSTYTIEMKILFNTIRATSGSRWIKIIDFQDLLDDNGLYSFDNSASLGTLSAELQFYPFTDSDVQDAMVPNVFTVITITRDDVTGGVSAYADGLGFSFADPDIMQDAVFTAGLMRFAQDDEDTSFEEAAAGAIDYIKLYDRVLTPQEVAISFTEGEAIPNENDSSDDSDSDSDSEEGEDNSDEGDSDEDDSDENDSDSDSDSDSDED